MSMVNQIVPNPGAVSSETLSAGFATPVEAARFLHLSKAMVHKLIGDGSLPARRFGRAVRIPWSWLLAQTSQGAGPACGGQTV